jgi:hypothetical protein
MHLLGLSSLEDRVGNKREVRRLDEKATAYKDISEAIERMGQALREGRRNDFVKFEKEVQELFRFYGYAE